jgi:hypothetical protein
MTDDSNIVGRGIPNLVVSQRVIDKMAAAAQHYMEDETGEAMVGFLAPSAGVNGIPTLYVVDTIAPDDSAVRQFHTFQQGDEHQDELIWWLQENWHIYRQQRRDRDGHRLAAKWDVPLRYLGDWHKQPGFMIQPSQGDLMTARRWIDDPDNRMDFLLAPIVTLGHPPTEIPPDANFITLPHGADGLMRVDFWYIDVRNRDFAAITPAIYPAEQLPGLPDYPWHLVDQERFTEECALLNKDGLFASITLWNVTEPPPLEICFLTARLGVSKVLLLITAWDYPAGAPSARVAPFTSIGPDDDLYEVFEMLWEQSEPIPDPPGWKWSADRHLLDYLHALETSLGLRPAKRPDAEKTKEENA